MKFLKKKKKHCYWSHFKWNVENGISVFENQLQKLSKFILNIGSLPKAWNLSFLVILHKKGGKSDPGYYRGLSITSGKYF